MKKNLLIIFFSIISLPLFILTAIRVFALTYTWSEVSLPGQEPDSGWEISSMSSDGQTILMGELDGRLYLTTSGGDNWNEVQPAGDTDYWWSSSSMDSTGETILVSGTDTINKMLYLSKDGGDNWEEIEVEGSAGPSWYMSSMSADGEIIIVGSTRLYLSTNGGETWSEVQPAGNKDRNWHTTSMSSDGQVIVVGVLHSPELYLSTNGGQDWILLEVPGSQGKTWSSTAMSSNGQIILAGAEDLNGGLPDGALYLSTDGGQNWNEIQPGGEEAENWNWSIASMSSDGQTMVVGMGRLNASDGELYGGKLYLSTNGGETWSEVQPYGTNRLNWSTASINSNGQTIFAADSAIRGYLSTDQGSSWSELLGVVYPPGGNPNQNWFTSSTSEDGDVVLVAGIGFNVSRTHGPYISLDKGQNWNEIDPSNGALQQAWFSSSMSSDGEVILIGGYKVYLSTDGGESWNEVQPAGDMIASWYTSSMSSDGEVMIVGQISGRIYLSTDGGESWNEVQPAGDQAKLWSGSAMSADGQTIVVLAQQGGGIYISRDGGESWSEIQPEDTTGNFWITSSMSADGQTILIGGAKYDNILDLGLFLSTNGGESWSEIQPAGGENIAWFSSSVSADGETMIVGNWGINEVGGFLPGQIYFSTNRGDDWNEIQPAGNEEKYWVISKISPNGEVIVSGDRNPESGGRIYIGTGSIIEPLSTTDTVEELVDSGDVSIPEDASPDSTSSLTVSNPGGIIIEVPVGNSKSMITLPSGTQITREDNESFNVNAVTQSTPSFNTLKNLASGKIIKGALQWGISGESLTFNPAITISIYVGESLNGKTLEVFRSTSGIGGWTVDGISPTTCTVEDGYCVFNATKASYYATIETASSHNSSSINRSANVKADRCAAIKPLGNPDLFQIDANNTEATLYFSPIHNSNKYFIAYGIQKGSEEYGVEFKHTDTSGVLSYTISHLSPNTTYYFKVRAGNNCMPGDWGHFMEIKTTKGEQEIKSYYKNLTSQLLSVFPRQINNINSDTNTCEYQVAQGDSLWKIARLFLGNGTLYPAVMQQNNLNSIIIRIGQMLRVGC